MPLSYEEFLAQQGKGATTDMPRITTTAKPDKVAALSNHDSAPVKALDLLSRITSAAATPMAKHVLAPLAKLLPISEEAKSKLTALENEKGTPTFATDVMDAAFGGNPGYDAVMGSPGILPTGGVLPNAARVVSRVALDQAADPLSYVGIGEATKAGRALTLVKEAKAAGQSIKLDSKLAKSIADIMGEAKPTPTLIKKFLARDTGVQTFSGQVAAGNRSLLSVVDPVAMAPLSDKLALTGKVAGAIAKPIDTAARAIAGTKVVKVFTNGARELFSNKTGLPEYDLLLDKYNNLLHYRQTGQLKQGQNINKDMEDITRGLGITRDELNSNVRNTLEQAYAPNKLIKRKYASDVFDKLDEHYTDKLVDAQVNLKNAQRVGDAALVDKHAREVVDYQGELNKLHNRYSAPPSINPQIDKVVKEIKEKDARQLFDEMHSGVQVKPQMADIEYMAHAATPEARDAAAQVEINAGRLPPKVEQKQLSENLAHAMRRQFTEVKPTVVDAWKSAGIIKAREAKVIKGKNGIDKMDELLNSGRITEHQYTDAVHTLTTDEVNALSAKGKLANMFGDYRGPVFHTDPVYATTIRGMRGERARTNAEFFNELKTRGLALEDNTANAGKIPANWVNVRQSELKGFKVPQEFAKVMDRWNEIYTRPNAITKILRQYDKFHSISKLWTLAPFPAYHTMNAVGNFWNNYLSGLTNPDIYRQAFMTQISKADTRFRPVNFKDIYGTKWNTEKLVDEAQKLGVIGRGHYAQYSGIEKTLTQSMEKGKFLTLSSRNHFLRTGQRVGQFIEDNARMAHFIDRLRKGDTAEEAASSVKKFLFDYGDLSNTERKVFNRAFFFYAWTRKNIPLQLHSLVSTPAKFGIPFKVKHELEKFTPTPPDEQANLPEWVKENFPNRIRYNPKTHTAEYFMLNRWLPAADLVKLSQLHEVAGNMLAPLPKEALQQLFNKDLYFKKDIQKFPGERDRFLGMDLPVRAVHGMKVIRLLNEIDKLSKPESDTFTKMVGLATGKNATVDFNKAKSMDVKSTKDDLNAIRSGILKAAGRGDRQEVMRLQKLLQERARQ